MSNMLSTRHKRVVAAVFLNGKYLSQFTSCNDMQWCVAPCAWPFVQLSLYITLRLSIMMFLTHAPVTLTTLLNVLSYSVVFNSHLVPWACVRPLSYGHWSLGITTTLSHMHSPCQTCWAPNTDKSSLPFSWTADTWVISRRTMICNDMLHLALDHSFAIVTIHHPPLINHDVPD